MCVCVCVNVYCTTATGWLPDCSYQIHHTSYTTKHAYARTHARTHTHGRTPLNKRLTRHRGRYLHSTQITQKTNIHALNWIRTCDPSNQAPSNLGLRPHGTRHPPYCNFSKFLALRTSKQPITVIPRCKKQKVKDPWGFGITGWNTAWCMNFQSSLEFIGPCIILIVE